MSPNRRLFWPFIITTLAVVCLHPDIAGDHVFYGDESSHVILVSFGLVLVLLALLRARWGASVSDGVALLLCGVPFLMGLLLGGDPPPLPREVTPWNQYDLRVLVDLRALGALGTLGLLVSELVTWSRFSTGGAIARPIAHGLLLALPFQLEWLGQMANGYLDVWRLNLLIAGLALVLLPLSLARGGARTGRLLVGLTFALSLVSVLKAPEFVRMSLGPHGCGPASDLERVRFAQQELFGFAVLEGFPWAPGLFALGASFFIRRQKVLLAFAVVTVFIGLDTFAISRLSRLHDPLSDSRRGDEFIPRGRGTRSGEALRLSEFVLLDPDGALLMRNPLADPESLGEALGAHTIVADASSCWNGPSTGYTRLPILSLELDARLSETQEFTIARLARRHGVVAIRLVEGEDRAAPGSPFLLSTHLARLAARNTQATFFLGRDSVPSECKPDGVRTTSSLEGLRWTDEFVLELPLSPAVE